ncbi:MAG: transcriptional repressor, partial [Rhodospirillales bacterium]|nr:transcriptional repressor [Rhodospirillales bacterium]
GILSRRDLGSRRARYEPSGEGHHFHLVDKDSGKVIEFEAPDVEFSLREIARARGLEIDVIKIELFGRRPAL